MLFVNQAEFLQYVGADPRKWAEQLALASGGDADNFLPWCQGMIFAGVTRGEEAGLTQWRPVLDVVEFHRAFSHPIAAEVMADDMGNLEVPLVEFRINFIKEEVEELADAWSERNGPMFLDALFDIAYVVFGTAIALGAPIIDAWGIGHESNMAKLGPDGVPEYHENGKVKKPEGWKKPDFKALLATVREFHAEYQKTQVDAPGSYRDDSAGAGAEIRSDERAGAALARDTAGNC